MESTEIDAFNAGVALGQVTAIQTSVEQGIYSWGVLYQDGTHLHEEESTSGWASVDQEHTKSLALFTHDGILAYRVDIPTGATPVFFRRKSITIAWEGENRHMTVHCIGWKRGEDATYLFIGESGLVLLTDNFQIV